MPQVGGMVGKGGGGHFGVRALCSNEAASTEKEIESGYIKMCVRVQRFTGCTCTVFLVSRPLVNIHDGRPRKRG